MTQSRGAFLRFLAASPLAAGLDLSACTGKPVPAGDPARGPATPFADPGLITRPEDALDVFDFRAIAQHVWGLASFDQRGVEKVLDLLRAELERGMRLAGLTSVSAIGPTAIGKG